MTDLLRYFPNAVEIGEGVALRASPFTSVCETEYYDGPIGGFAFLGEVDTLAVFKKIWWDQAQDNRLFELHLIEIKQLGDVSGPLSGVIARAARERWTSLPTTEREVVSPLFDAAAQLGHTHLFVLARDIAGPLFILPFASDL